MHACVMQQKLIHSYPLNQNLQKIRTSLHGSTEGVP